MIADQCFFTTFTSCSLCSDIMDAHRVTAGIFRGGVHNSNASFPAAMHRPRHMGGPLEWSVGMMQGLSLTPGMLFRPKPTDCICLLALHAVGFRLGLLVHSMLALDGTPATDALEGKRCFNHLQRIPHGGTWPRIHIAVYDDDKSRMGADKSWTQYRFSTRIKDAGIAIRHSRWRILFYTAGSGNGLEGVDNRVSDTEKSKLTLRKRHFFVMEKYVEDVKQKEKDVLDLVESIMKGSGLVKEELRPSLFKLSQSRPKSTKIRVSTFWIREIWRIPAGGQCQPSR